MRRPRPVSVPAAPRIIVRRAEALIGSAAQHRVRPGVLPRRPAASGPRPLSARAGIAGQAWPAWPAARVGLRARVPAARVSSQAGISCRARAGLVRSFRAA